jgi:hypothetical protein
MGSGAAVLRGPRECLGDGDFECAAVAVSSGGGAGRTVGAAACFWVTATIGAGVSLRRGRPALFCAKCHE